MKEDFETFKEEFRCGFSYDVGYCIYFKPEHDERLKAIYDNPDYQHLNGHEAGVFMGFTEFRDAYDAAVASFQRDQEIDALNYEDETL